MKGDEAKIKAFIKKYGVTKLPAVGTPEFSRLMIEREIQEAKMTPMQKSRIFNGEGPGKNAAIKAWRGRNKKK